MEMQLPTLRNPGKMRDLWYGNATYEEVGNNEHKCRRMFLRKSSGKFGDIKLTYDTGVLVLTKELAVYHFSFDFIL